MAERALKCPQCTAPLAPSRFARTATCPYCGSTVVLDEAVVSAARFRAAHRAWTSPASHGYSTWLTVGDSHWAPGELLAHGEIADVYRAERARWPTERVVLKILRDPHEKPRFDNEWEVLEVLQLSEAPGAVAFTRRLPVPVLRGEVRLGSRTGASAMAFGWVDGFLHTFEDVRRFHPRGIEPRASIWVWRRILEVLSFLHASGFVHGAVLPPHLLVEDGEHGVRLVGYGCAGFIGTHLAAVSTGFEGHYPAEVLDTRNLTPGIDIAMSARAVAALLGGNPATGKLPASVPETLAGLISEAGAWGRKARPPGDAWALRERLGRLAQEIYGAPRFCPIAMPRPNPATLYREAD